ncbi:hypothetical protein B0A49_01166 [Cryomyces minteri]|uniref:AB hydrolase-1 domain-containing protein n=1 Tax=Cryomyces minteri TaxID=331657 RepID=A0A4U0WX11_9PEZI|nr:hypothetical protein B0A49_05590 [Cryomyces minteri]TKA74795.1 hypothetical protein B0A49_01875 [Cryomyces minteri]TKA78669.1 hypothetical protein B0A49_01166 [Cryomyces minteri]
MTPILNTAIVLLSAALTVSCAAEPESTCTDFIAPVTVTAPSYGLQFPPFENGYQATHFLNVATNRDAGLGPSPLKAPVNVTQTFDISARYCTPAKTYARDGKGGSVMLLTHGIGFDKSYWSFGNATYNYVLAATRAGYSTLSYDRLGTGLSSHPSAYTAVQAPTELAVLTQLTTLLRSGTLGHRIPAPATVVHVGHSWGSILSCALAAATPSLSDGLVLTGFTHNATWMNDFAISTGFRLARDAAPARFAALDSGYLTWPDALANQYAFFAYPFFDPAVLRLAEARKQPFAVAELLTEPLVYPVVAAEFAAPVLIVVAEFDLIFCGGACGIPGSSVYVPPGGKAGDAPSAAFFPKARPFDVVLQPRTGHGMNLHYNASSMYEVTFGFLRRNGL